MRFLRHREPTPPSDPTLVSMIAGANRAARLARNATDRGREGRHLTAVADLAEAVREAQAALHDAVTISRDAGVDWSELSTYTGTEAGYLEQAHERYDPNARLLVPTSRREGWRPLG
jgi:nucleotide-binding universal stress UspA family protein